MTNGTKNLTDLKSFVLHKDSLEILNKLSDEEAGKLFKAIYQYQIHGEIVDDLSPTTDLVVTPFLKQFERDWESYHEKCERNRQNIAKRWQKAESEKKPTIKKTRFVKPKLSEVQEYCSERNNNVTATDFINYYDSKGWIVGKSPMKDWKAAVRNWEANSSGKLKAHDLDKVNYNNNLEGFKTPQKDFKW